MKINTNASGLPKRGEGCILIPRHGAECAALAARRATAALGALQSELLNSGPGAAKDRLCSRPFPSCVANDNQVSEDVLEPPF